MGYGPGLVPVGLEIGEAAGDDIDTDATAGHWRVGGKVIWRSGLFVGQDEQQVKVAVRSPGTDRTAAE